MRVQASAEAGKEDYVFQVALNRGEKNVFCSLSSMCIGIHDISDELSQLSCIKAHNGRINCIQTSEVTPHTLISGADDEYVKYWDIRTPCVEPALMIKCKGEVTEASLGVNDLIIATATGTNVSFYDTRYLRYSFEGSKKSNNSNSVETNCVGEYGDVHTDTIYALKFHPTRRTELLTAGEDGLVCYYDTNVISSADSVLSVLNVECDVRTIGFFGPELEGVYCLSTVETASFWHLRSALRVVNLPGVRDTFQIDYLVDCISSGSTGGVQMLAGTTDGKGIVLDIHPDKSQKLFELDGGHEDIIRCAAPLECGGLITGGEDSKLCYFH